MPLGGLITTLSADLAQYERDLNAAYAKAEAWSKRVEALQTRLSAPGMGRAGGGGGSGSIDAEYRRIETARLAAEREFRQRGATQDAAEREQRQRLSTQAQAERDNARLGAETMRAKNADIKQQLLFRRELDRLDKEEAQAQRRAQSEGQRMAGAQQSAQREDLLRSRAARIAAEFEKSNSVIGRMDKALLALDGGSLQNVLGTVKQIGRAFGIAGAFGVAGAVAAFTKGGIELNREYQRQLTTMASILAMTTRVVDSQGHQVGRQQALNFQLAESGKLYTLIRREAASTILTGRELFGAVSSNLGLGAAAGLSDRQTVELAKQVTQLAKASGLSGDRAFARQTRAILTGSQLQSSPVARILGIFSKKQITDEIQKGDLFEYIMERINKAKPFLDKFRTSFDGVMTTLTTKAQDLNRMAFEKFFEKLTKRIGDLNKALTEERLEQWAEKISDGLIKVFDAIDHFVSGDGFKQLMSLLNFLVANGAELIKIFVAMRAALAVGGLAANLRGFQQNQVSRAAQAAELAGQAGQFLPQARSQALRSGARAGVAEAEQVAGTVAGGGLAAGGIAAARGVGMARLAAVAGAVGSGLSILSAGLTGLAIGRGLDQLGYHLSGEADAAKKEQQSRADLEGTRAGRAAQGARLQEAKERVREAASMQFDPERGEKASAAKLRDATLYRERQVQQEITAERQKGADANLHLESLAKEKNERARREAANEERVKSGLELAKLRDDKVREINAQAQLDALQQRKKIADTSLLRKVLFEIERKRVDDIHDLREKEAIDFKQDMAKRTGSVRDAAAADHAAALKAIEDKKRSGSPAENESRQNQEKLAATEEYQRKLRKIDSDETLRKRELHAEATQNAIEQINIEYAKRAEAIQEEVRTHYKGQAAIRELNKETADNEIARRREVHEKTVQLQDQARDLARKSKDTERERAETIKKFTREIADAQKQAARQLLDLTREQADAQRDLGRVQRAAELDTRRIGHPERTVFTERRFVDPMRRNPLIFHDPVHEAATEGTEAVNFKLRDEAAKLLSDSGIEDQLRRALALRSGDKLGDALANRQLRQLREQFGSGDLQGGLQQLQESGIRPTYDFLSGARDLRTRALNNEETGAQLGEDQAREQLKQQQEDASRPTEDAQRRVHDLAQQRAEVIDSFNATNKRLNTEFNQALLKSADDLKSLSEEAKKLNEQLKASAIAVSQGVATGLRKAAGGPTTQAGAEAAVKAQGAPVYNLIFNEKSINLDATGQEALRALADTLTQQKLRTAPARR